MQGQNGNGQEKSQTHSRWNQQQTGGLEKQVLFVNLILQWHFI